MKITIDTKEDSHEEIKKVIRMLSSLVGEQEVFSNQSNIFSEGSETGNSNQSGTSDIFNIFNDNSKNKTEEEKAEEDKKEDDIDLSELKEYR